ncbi:MAG TPA: two-component regulator propeller domain-containing protein, partial [Vicinamibacterales bacterium]|nr:two-component regulator propeller domain-containing protein [Vicinamibacterales bacterium]
MNRNVPAAVLASVMMLCAAATAVAQEISGYALTTWTDADGPFAGDAWAIAQDSRGYLWFGTPHGLVRFDGVSFVRWQGADALPTTRITSLCAARDGSLWIGYGLREGVSRIINDRVESYAAGKGLVGGVVPALLEDSSGAIWAGGNGLSVFQNGRWRRVPIDGTADRPVQSLYQDSSGGIWVGTASAVFVKRAHDDGFSLFSTAFRGVRSFSEESDGAIWATDSTTVLAKLADSSTGSPRPPPAGRRGSGMSLVIDREANMWVGTLGHGLLRVRSSADASAVARGWTEASSAGSRVVEQLTTADGLASDFVRKVFADRDGSIWFGMQGGLGRLSRSSVATVIGGRNLNHGYIRSVVVSTDGAVWLSSSDGLQRYLNGRWTTFEDNRLLASGGTNALAAAPDGSVWIATEHGPLHYVGGRFLNRLPAEPRLDRITAMTVEHDGALWVCDYRRGVYRWSGNTLARVDNLPGLGIGYSVITDRRGRVWLGMADGGVFAYEHGQRAAAFHAGDGLATGTVNAIYEDGSGTIWVATTEGLSRIRDGRLAPIRHVAFLEHGVLSMVADTRGFLWLGVFSGLIRVDPAQLDQPAAGRSLDVRYQRFDASDGLRTSPRRESFPSAARDADGALWFLTQRGAAVIDPQFKRDNRRAPAVTIEKIVVDDHDTATVPNQRLGPGAVRVRIDYTAPSLAGSAKTRFRYQLEGVDPEWVDAGTRRQAFYTNLAPGAYRFRVAAENDGVWNDASTTWDFEVAPAFYQTAWFALLCVAALTTAVGVIWWRRERHLHERYSLVLAERARVGRELHDTLLQGLFGLALQFDGIVELLNSSPDAAKASLKRARGHVEGYIRETRHSIWNLRSPSLGETTLTAALQRTGESFVAGTPVRFTLTAQGPIRRGCPDFEEQVLRIGQEAISNAV